LLEGGEPVALGTLKERLVLAVLLLHANEFVPRERLIDELCHEQISRELNEDQLAEVEEVLAASSCSR